MKSIKIGFSKPKKFKIGAWLIQKWMNKPYSHVYVKYNDNQGRSLIFHAAHGIVHQISEENFTKENTIIKTHQISFTDSEYQTFRDYYYSKVGSAYGYLDLIKIPLYDMGILKVSENSVGYICSELLSEMLFIIKKVLPIKQFNLMKPSDVEIQVDRGDYGK